MAQDPAEALRVGQLWARIAEEHDVEKFSTLLADDFRMWYNFDPVDRTRDAFIETLKSAHAIFDNQRNIDERITATAEGFVLQATMTGVLDGVEIAAPYCLVARMRDGKVVHGSEYFDTSHLPKKAGKAGEGMV
jgi:ketosteroid isomerase-like protein